MYLVVSGAVFILVENMCLIVLDVLAFGTQQKGASGRRIKGHLILDIFKVAVIQ
jgi:hypothetical protein